MRVEGIEGRTQSWGTGCWMGWWCGEKGWEGGGGGDGGRGGGGGGGVGGGGASRCSGVDLCGGGLLVDGLLPQVVAALVLLPHAVDEEDYEENSAEQRHSSAHNHC